MPCIRDYRETDSWGFMVGPVKVDVVDPREVVREARRDLKTAEMPKWNEDPSYFWGRNRRRKALR